MVLLAKPWGVVGTDYSKAPVGLRAKVMLAPAGLDPKPNALTFLGGEAWCQVGALDLGAVGG